MKEKTTKKNLKTPLLIAVPIVAVVLIVFGKDGYGFGIIALICWALAFLDLARIKLGDYEIDFMNKADVLTAEEKKKIEENYSAVKSFLANFYKTREVSDDELKNLALAKQEAELYLPNDIVMYVNELYDVAYGQQTSSTIEAQLNSKKHKGEVHSEILEANSFLYKTKPEKIYRKFLKVGQHDKD